jgi:hypothetical protein
VEWVGLFIVIVILGAIAGGNSLGETIRNGIGCLVLIFLALVALVMFAGGSQ